MRAGRPEWAKARAHLAAAAVAVVVTTLMTWPLARDAGDHVLEAKFYWDAYTNAMILGCRVDSILGLGPLGLYDNYFFAPVKDTIVFNENLFGLTPIFAPFYLASGNPLWAYNVTLLLSLSLSVFFTYLLVRHVTSNGYAGVLAGVAFAFCPYITFEIARLQLVCTQWIPACFLMLHLAVEKQRLRYVVGLWLCFVLQIGTCLYYAMFLIPVLSLVGGMLLVRHRPPPRFYLKLAAVGASALLIAMAMVYPYFAAREAFSLERSLDFAADYDGKLSFFGNVYSTNRTLGFLQHQADFSGPYEEIAFPGFTVLVLLAIGLGRPLWGTLNRLGPKQSVWLFGRWAALGALVFLGTVLFRTMLAGAMVFGLGLFWELRRASAGPFAGVRGLYLALLVLSVVLFLGLRPLEWHGEVVRGLYYYLHRYVPGFDGIRKISRWAVLTSFAFAILASFGSAWLFEKLSQKRAQMLALTGFLALTCFELRVFPHPVKKVWSPSTLPEVYRFVAELPREDIVVFTPNDDGVHRFWRDPGMMLHNYLTLYHKHRSLNGESSWVPPVTELAGRVLPHLTDEAAWRVLWAVGARHVVVFAEDLPRGRRAIASRLAEQTEHYERTFQKGTHSVFSLRAPQHARSAGLAEVPVLPEGARLVNRSEMQARASLSAKTARRAVDGNTRSFWTSGRVQATGQYVEFRLTKSHELVALEIENHRHVMDMPASFELSVAEGGSDFHTVVRQPKVRIYREQVDSPRKFVYRVVLPGPTRADRVRISIAQALPGHYFTIHEARLYERGPS